MLFTRRRFIGLSGAMAGGFALGTNRLASADGEDSRARTRAEEADRLIASKVNSGEVASVAFLMRQGKFEFARAYGRAKIDTPFLIASPTKPMTASAVMWLRERKQLELTEQVVKYLPDFKGDGREAVTIRHLLTHTSGLPDMLPENVDLRRRHAPLREFVIHTCRTPLLFRPGEQVSYQSMGILLAAAIVEKVSGQSMPAFLAEKVFLPLGMSRTSLGLGGRKIEDTAQSEVPEAERNAWDWNSPYWRNLAAPWGGAHSTVHDLATFTEAFVSAGPAPWAHSTRREMREVQTGGLRQSYGYGWRLDAGAFGKNCSPATFGHHGSTGTVVWHDPQSAVTCVILTSRPATDSKATLLGPVSDIVSGRSV